VDIIMFRRSEIVDGTTLKLPLRTGGFFLASSCPQTARKQKKAKVNITLPG